VEVESLTPTLLLPSGGAGRRRSRTTLRRSKAAEAEARIMVLLGSSPGMKSTELAKATDAKVNTTIERLKRMKVKGLALAHPNSAFRRARLSGGQSFLES
jgi:hypothetical protein